MAAIIRRAEPKDARDLTAVMRDSAAYDGVYRVMVADYAVQPDQIAKDQVFLAEDHNQVLGFYSLVTDGAPELDLMFVADAAQGRSIGRLLFDHMRSIAKGLGIRSVKIVSHPPSAGFYRRMGAVDDGLRFPRGRVTWWQPVLRVATDVISDNIS